MTIHKSYRRMIFALALAVFGTSMLDVLSSLFLVDIAKTFLGDSSLPYVAIASQIATISSIAAVVLGILSGFLSVRISHKKLLIIGAVCIVTGTVGCFLAPNLLFMQIFYPFDGIGTIIVGAMTLTIIGESLPLEQRGRSIGMVTAGGILSSAIGFAVAGYISVAGGWRSYLLWYVLPIAITAATLAYLLIPSQTLKQEQIKRASFKTSFREVLGNKSAIACLLGNTLITASGIWSFYGATFWQKQFLISIQNVGIISLTVILIYAVGSLVGGRLINMAGRKHLVVVSWVARGLLIAAIVFMPSFLTALIITCLATFVGGIAIASGHSLSLEQAPRSRGTMMSLIGVFGSIGASVGLAAGGIALSSGGFQFLGVTLGAFAVVSATAIFLLAKDPTKL